MVYKLIAVGASSKNRSRVLYVSVVDMLTYIYSG